MPDGWEAQYGLVAGAMRPMRRSTSDADGRTNVQECQDLTHPRGLYTRYLAEGATGAFFSTRVVIANPNAAPARVLFRFLTNTGAVVRRFQTIPSNARRTIDLQLLAGLEAVNISTVVESDTEIVVDRTMRWDSVARFGSHAEASVPAPSLQWYLAEGATHGVLRPLLSDPEPEPDDGRAGADPLPAAGRSADRAQLHRRRRTAASRCRWTQIPELASTDVSAVIQSTNGGADHRRARDVFVGGRHVFAAGHDSAGVTAPSHAVVLRRRRDGLVLRSVPALRESRTRRTRR